jgi:dCMP deaminase
MTRDEKMMRWAFAGAEIFSTCAKRQYMAIIVSPEGRVLGTGYNGAPPGVAHCTDGYCPRMQENSPSGSSYSNCISIHAEANALMYTNRDERNGGTLYVNGQPCWDCGKLIAGSGLARAVIVHDPAYEDAFRVNTFIMQAGISVYEMDAP